MLVRLSTSGMGCLHHGSLAAMPLSFFAWSLFMAWDGQNATRKSTRWRAPIQTGAATDRSTGRWAAPWYFGILVF
ncbi:hypothetical protein ACEF06_03940 [Brevibacillus agri]